MEKQSLKKQILFGAIFGLIFSYSAILKNSEAELNLYVIGELIGGAIGGAVLYCILYRFWPKK
ncbi:hypothetical protein [Undibacterium pigrum]|uniref:Uncharacterized protein n=1 Tax=Undibacterium pigrum TaxID=401470 RepID=A0A318J7A7_9BURK|nr:hypothetical protein [Undibacterium pigrum]PXX42519.1 hypothetical protein DFR42_105177 [Undibacterium pigrum]